MLSTRALIPEVVNKLLRKAEYFKTSPFYQDPFVLVNAFFEPSTRTSLSFASAAHRLGGSVINFNKDVSSMKKGESFKDTISTLSLYGDLLVVRHPEKGSVEIASEYSACPVINAGDGDGDHPTQALLDLFTIYYNFKSKKVHHPLIYLDQVPKETSFKPYNVLFVGDLAHSRTIRSLIYLLHMFPPVNIHLLPYSGCSPSFEMIQELREKNDTREKQVVFDKETIDWGKYDVIYSTRLQKERTSDVDDAVNLVLDSSESLPNKQKAYETIYDEDSKKENVSKKVDVIIDNSVTFKMKNDAMIMHPLPRNEEISTDVDNDPRAFYFEQMDNGVCMRMAIIKYLLYYYGQEG